MMPKFITDQQQPVIEGEVVDEDAKPN